ncbi:hypothetical protein ACJJTC_019546 [Scirpophaga incertulas]
MNKKRKKNYLSEQLQPMTETLEAVRSELRTMREQKRVPLSSPPVSLRTKLPAEAAVTADVISNMNKLFDSLNSDSSTLRRDELFGAVRAENPDLTDSEWQLLLTLLQSEGLHQANGLIKPELSGGYIAQGDLLHV